MTKKKKKQMPSGDSPSGSPSRSGTSDSQPSSPTLAAEAPTVVCSSQMNESQLLCEINSSTSLTILELQGCAAAVADKSGNPISQASATIEIVPEEVGPEATSTQIHSVVPSPVIVEPSVEQLSTQLPSLPSEGIKSQVALWKDKVSPNSGKLEPEGTPFTLDSGETCVKIPNAIIEKNRKSWDSFILGQFYEEAPAKGAVHAIVNGMWSKQRRDISVSKMDGKAFLFRVPCPNARRRILSQCLWQVDGQTMFVAKWSPGVKPEKPALSTVPVWLDFVGVPLQFFNKDALKEIAGLVGHPICLHPSTENLTNIEVAKVYTVIDPRKPLPEAVNAQFEPGEVVRIQVCKAPIRSLHQIKSA
ncbi:hypothetical protein N665_0481s0006 [Sinapis alba]|nr:hypothetical protein N665_0481s0006 [Sinapis alba]